MRKILIYTLVLSMLFLTGCVGGGNESVKATEVLFDTVVEIELFDGNRSLLDGAMQLCEDYHKLFDPDDPESDVYRLNNSGGNFIEVGDDTLSVLEKAMYYSRLSGGTFDITVRSVSLLWDFTGDGRVIPSGDEINMALSSVDYNNIIIDSGKVCLANSAQIDFGAVAKGYIADRLKDYLLENGCENAIINMGGNILFLGQNESHEAFSVGIQKPFGKTGELCAYINNIRDVSVVTCGNYMRYFEKDGKVYHHIIDTGSGMPVENGLSSVTVICESSAEADCLSTLCFTLGREKGIETIETLNGVEAVFVLENGDIFNTSGLKEKKGELPQFTLK